MFIRSLPTKSRKRMACDIFDILATHSSLAYDVFWPHIPVSLMMYFGHTFQSRLWCILATHSSLVYDVFWPHIPVSLMMYFGHTFQSRLWCILATHSSLTYDVFWPHIPVSLMMYFGHTFQSRLWCILAIHSSLVYDTTWQQSWLHFCNFQTSYRTRNQEKMLCLFSYSIKTDKAMMLLLFGSPLN